MEGTLGRINEVVSEAAGQLQLLWTEIGFNEDACQHRQHKMVEHVKVGLCGFIVLCVRLVLLDVILSVVIIDL